MEYIYIFLGVLFIIAGLAFSFGRTHIQLFAWENMPEQGRDRIMPLCRCVGEVIVLSGLIFLMKGLWAGFSEHWLAGSIAAWGWRQPDWMSGTQRGADAACNYNPHCGSVRQSAVLNRYFAKAR